MTNAPPNWFDWAGLAVDGLTPLAVVLLGLMAARYADRLERNRALDAVAVNWRIEVFRNVAPQLNLLRCFFTYVGDWRRISLDQATAAKRDCDRMIYMNAFLFAPDTIDAWRDFVATAFDENRGPGRDFAFRASVARHRQENVGWREDWAERFVTHEQRVTRKAFVAAHDRVLALVVRDLGVGHRT